MATTTNYGWTTPDDTARVKDGAAAIRTLGTSVDTTTKNLNPSTTLGDIEYRSSTSNTNTRLGIGSSGQGLQVVAGVPSWAASSTSTLTTTGDLLYASAANTLARRAIGTTGQVLTVSGGVPTWASASASALSYTLLSTTSLTAASSITISSLSGYNYLWIIVESASSVSASSNITARFNSDTGSNYATYNMDFTNGSTYAAANYLVGGFGSYTSIGLGNIGNNAGNRCSASLSVFGANSSNHKMIQYVGGGDQAGGSSNNQNFVNGAAIYKGSSVISSFTIISGTGNFDAGTVYVYGAN
jgi:hypothetical protein